LDIRSFMVCFMNIEQEHAASAHTTSTDPAGAREESCAHCSECEAAADADALRTERHLDMLQELARMGMDLARAVHKQGVAQAESVEPVSEPAAEAALAFSRLAKTVRQCLALEARVADQQRRRELGEIDQAGELFKQSRRYLLGAKRRQVKRAVSDAIEAEAESGGLYPSDAERLFDRLDERIEDEVDDFDDRPVGALIERLCRKLGVAPDWARWQAEDWAVEEIAERPKGSPYADWAAPIVDAVPGSPLAESPPAQPSDAGHDPPSGGDG
jgi:hypothetical protein